VPDSEYRLLPDDREAPRTRLEDARRAGGYVALQRAVTSMTRGQVLGEIRTSNLRGRGGGEVRTAEKLAIVSQAGGDTKYVVCNAYDADPRSLIARTLLSRDPHRIIEGMALAGYAIGATEGYLYMRGAPAEVAATVREALAEAADQHVIGRDLLGSRATFNITLVGVDLGFMAGEETTMLEVIKGKRAMPQQRPPYPTQFGLDDKPTAILNVETVANLPAIIARGGEAFRRVGADGNPGTKLFTVHGAGLPEGGTLVEVPQGAPLAQALERAGVRVTAASARAVVVGGLEGGALPLAMLNTTLDFNALDSSGAIVGSSVIEVLPADTCMVAWATGRMAALARESCGKCIPCRVGVKRVAGTLEGIMSDLGNDGDLKLLDEFARYIPDGSLCGFGVHAVHPVVSAMRYFGEDFKAHLEGRCPTGTCLPVRAHRYVTKHVL
jgi:NADH:ubiquinone oxidoreductase subunit F (NADH-binding)